MNIETDTYIAGDVKGDVVAGDKIGGDKIGGDKITVSNSEDTTIAAGEHSAAASSGGVAISGNVGGNLTISVGNTELVLPVTLQVTIGFIVMAIVLLIGIVIYHTNIAPTLVKMKESFNTAIAQFQIDGSGEGLKETINLSQVIASTIGREFDELGTSIERTIAICPHPSGTIQTCPSQIGKIEGNDEEDRAKNAAILAEKINAHIVIYGVVEVGGKKAIVRPEFYISNEQFRENPEISGQYWMGSEIPISDITNSSLKSKAERKLKDRFRTLSFIINGLADYTAGKFDADKFGSLWIPDWYSGLSLGLGRQRSQDSVGS